MNGSSYSCGQTRRSISFKTVRFKSIDYISETSARRRLTRNLLELPVPLQLLGNTFPHNGQLQDNAYRTPWSNKISTSKLPVTGSLMEDLKECTRFRDRFERLSVFQVRTGRGPDEVVPSSNPGSQCSISATEALWHSEEVESSENTSPWEESFTPCTLDDSHFSYDDLTLPEEVIFTDRLRFKNHLPSVHTMLQRLKLMTVSDPFHHSSAMLSDDVIFRHCASYSTVSDGVSDVTATEENLTEVFQKEAVLNEESLMLPVEVHVESVRRHETSFPLGKLQDLLNLTPESMEDQKPCANLHMEVTSADKHKTELEVLQTEESSSWDSFGEPKSPGALRLYTEMELDLPLSPCNDTPADLFLPDGPLSPEQLSPVYKQHFMSDSDFENREKSVWMAEKHRECVAGFFLAEPQMSKPSVHTRTLSDLLMLLKVKTEHVENMEQPHFTDARAMLPKNLTDLCVYAEKVQTTDIETHQIEKFSPLSILQIDEMLFAANADRPVAVPPAQSNHPETAGPAHEDEEKPVKLLRMEQTREINCKTAQTAQDVSNSTSFKHKTPERCPERNDSRTNCPSGEQPIFSKEVFKSPPSKHRDMKGMSTVHERPERFDQKREGMTCRSSQLLNSSNGRHVNHLQVKSHENLDPLSFFMMLRTSRKSPVQTPRQSSPASAEVNAREMSTEKTLRANMVTNTKENVASTEKILTREERTINETIYVQATEIQRSAYRELNVLAVPCLSRAVESGVTALNNRDFATLSSELTRFLLKQQERIHYTQQGADGVFDDITLLHVLVTLKELLLKCDLDTAADYLSQVRSSCHLKCLDELMKKFEVLQYLSRKRSEPDPKLLELQDQMSTWMNSNMNHNNRVLVLTVKPVNTEVLTALGQASGNSVCAVVPEEDKSRVTCRDVMNSLSSSSCVALCRQHVGADFPWRSFSLVFELHCVDHSPFSSLCSERNIKYTSFSTAVAEFKDRNSASYLDSIPFVLLVTDGLLKSSRIQRALETTYDMTLLERKHPPSAQKLGGDHYDVITVDENTAVFIQKLSELEMEKASNRVVMRLSSLSLQFTRCWLILHCSESHRALISRSIYLNLVLIYSSFVLFGQQSEKFDVKVLLACEEEDIARYIYQISVHTLMSSDRDALSWLDRDWISVLPTEEERCLLRFPCINPLVAQLMLSRAPSLQWLLEASLVDLQEMFPQVPHKVIKLFNDIIAENKVKTAASESQDEASSQTNISPHLPHPQTEICQSQQSTEYFTVSLSGRQEGKTSVGQFREPIGQHLCFTQENHTSDPAWTLSNTLFSQDSATLNVWQPQDEGHVHFISDLTPQQAAVLSGPQMLSFRNTACEFSCRRQDQTHWTSPENTADRRTEERKRPRTEDANSVPLQCKRGKLLCERVPGRNDGQTRLRFF